LYAVFVLRQGDCNKTSVLSYGALTIT